ncbi:MAG: hypothetical protein KGN98_00750 [Alphaproteobacteria bacterium]|jgi:hypothetical protein|nr:hypothetical protein [Alphaproteobacteria bacterium]
MHLASLTGAAFVGIAYLPFCFMIVALEAGLASLMAREGSPPRRIQFQAAPA